MENFFVYLFKSCLWIAAFWAVYRVFLRSETFHTFNRWYLLAGLGLSFVLPLVRFHYNVETTVPADGIDRLLAMAGAGEPAAAAATAPGWLHAAAGLYTAGILLLIAGSLRHMRRIRRLVAEHGYTACDGYRLVETARAVSPFSFRNYIFIDPARVSEAEKRIIIAHESSHIRHRHWVDLAAGQVLRIAQWLNPFARLLVREMKDNHEFMADRAVLAGGNSLAAYKAALANSSCGARVFALGHPFSASNNLKRYKMMNRKTSSPARKLLSLSVLPLAALIFTAFAEPRYTAPEPPRTTERTEPPTSEDIPHFRIKMERGQVKTKPTSRVELFFADSLKMDKTDPEKKPLVIVDGLEKDMADMERLDPAAIASVTVLKDASATKLHGERARNGVIVIETKSAAKAGDITVNTGDQAITVLGPKPIARSKVIVGWPDIDTDNPPLWLVDGQIIGKDIVESLDPEKIESVTILKDKSATELYGEEGRNGVIVITLKK